MGPAIQPLSAAVHRNWLTRPVAFELETDDLFNLLHEDHIWLHLLTQDVFSTPGIRVILQDTRMPARLPEYELKDLRFLILSYKPRNLPGEDFLVALAEALQALRPYLPNSYPTEEIKCSWSSRWLAGAALTAYAWLVDPKLKPFFVARIRVIPGESILSEAMQTHELFSHLSPKTHERLPLTKECSTRSINSCIELLRESSAKLLQEPRLPKGILRTAAATFKDLIYELGRLEYKFQKAESDSDPSKLEAEIDDIICSLLLRHGLADTQDAVDTLKRQARLNDASSGSTYLMCHRGKIRMLAEFVKHSVIEGLMHPAIFETLSTHPILVDTVLELRKQRALSEIEISIFCGADFAIGEKQ